MSSKDFLDAPSTAITIHGCPCYWLPAYLSPAHDLVGQRSTAPKNMNILCKYRPRPVQPPLPPDEAGDIINRLDRPAGFTTVTNPLHEGQGANFGRQAQHTQQEKEEEEEEEEEAEEQLNGGVGALPPDAPPGKLTWLARFR